MLPASCPKLTPPPEDKEACTKMITGCQGLTGTSWSDPCLWNDWSQLTEDTLLRSLLTSRCLRSIVTSCVPVPPTLTSSISTKLEINPKWSRGFRTWVCHLLSLLAFQMKSPSLPQHLLSQIAGMSCGGWYELGLGNKKREGCLKPRKEIISRRRRNQFGQVVLRSWETEG